MSTETPGQKAKRLGRYPREIRYLGRFLGQRHAVWVHCFHPQTAWMVQDDPEGENYDVVEW